VTIAIVGVGLIGGSFARALRRHGFRGRLIGVSSPRTLAAALARRVVDQGLPLEDALRQSDWVYLAQPVARILELLPEVARLARRNALVTDAGSTKSLIVARARELFPRGVTFLGGHPMAGKAERGVQAADADLFRGAVYVLTPAGARLPRSQQVRRFCSWLKKIGARPWIMTPEDHDRTVAFTSHLPQLCSTALGSLLEDKLPARDSWLVAGGGLRDALRLAASPYEVWRDICLTNSGNIDRALLAYIQKLEYLRENLRQRALREEFERAAGLAARFSAGRRNRT